MMMLKERAYGGESNVVEYRYSGDRVRKSRLLREKGVLEASLQACLFPPGSGELGCGTLTQAGSSGALKHEQSKAERQFWLVLTVLSLVWAMLIPSLRQRSKSLTFVS